MRLLASLALLGLLAAAPASAQHEAAEPSAEGEHESLKGVHRLTLGLGHEHVPRGEVEGESKWLTLPSWSLNYDYRLAERWGVGFQTDLILESFVVEAPDGASVERSYPLSLVPVAFYSPTERLLLIGGTGVEVAAGEQTLWMTRFGAEYGVEVGRKWEVGATAVWDARWNYYDAWGIAFTVSRRWR